MPRLVAVCLRAEHRFGDTVLSAFVRPPGRPAATVDADADADAVDGLVREARLARSNAEAAVQRMATETPGVGKGTLPLDAAEEILGEMHHYGLAGLSLRVHLHPHRRHRAARPRGHPPGADHRLHRARRGHRRRRPGAVARPALPPPDAIPPTPIARLVAEETGAMATAIDTAITAYDRHRSPA